MRDVRRDARTLAPSPDRLLRLLPEPQKNDLKKRVRDGTSERLDVRTGLELLARVGQLYLAVAIPSAHVNTRKKEDNCLNNVCYMTHTKCWWMDSVTKEFWRSYTFSKVNYEIKINNICKVLRY